MAATATKEFVISRVFDAPRNLVWKVFSDQECMKEWWGPKGFTVFSSKMDFRPGGTYLYGMKAPDGTPMWGKFTYCEIVAPEKIVAVNNFSDEAGGVTRHPMAPTWPLKMLTILTFEEQPGGKTKFTVHWSTLEANEEEQKTLDSSHDSMRQGWSGTMERLEAYLAKVR